jgi:hypothetical protein
MLAPSIFSGFLINIHKIYARVDILYRKYDAPEGSLSAFLTQKIYEND